MRDYLGGMTREELEQLALRLIRQGPEGLKVDFKRSIAVGTNAEKAEFSKDVSSIANTDDHTHLDDYGFIVVGADRGTVVGAAADFAPDKIDSYQARLTDVVREWVAPVPSFSLVGFQDADAGPWGVIVLPPSAGQPHILVRDGLDAARHEWWVRVNDTKVRAGVLDYARILSKTATRVTRPMEFELQRLAARMDLVEQGSTNLKDIVSLFDPKSRPDSPSPAAKISARSTVQQVRHHLMTPAHEVEDALISEALRVVQVMNSESPEYPWIFTTTNPQTMLRAIEHLEGETRPLAEALATVARYDESGLLTPAVVTVFEALAREPEPTRGSSFGMHATSLRLYPVAICLYTLAFVGTAKKRGALLGAVLASKFTDRNNQSSPLMQAIRQFRSAEDVFRVALQEPYFEAAAERLSAVIPVWCAGLVPARPGLTTFLQAEFVIGLAYLAVSRTVQADTFPFPGKYLYAYEARNAIGELLQKQPRWLEDVYRRPILDVLQEFDSTAAGVLDRRSFGRHGFVNGAVHAWNLGTNP